MNAQQINNLENSLWEAAGQLRANSKLTATEYSMPLLGLIFLRHAYNRFLVVKDDFEASLPDIPGRGKRPVNKNDFLQAKAIFLPEKARFNYLLDLEEDKNMGEALNDAMKLIEDEYPNLQGCCPIII